MIDINEVAILYWCSLLIVGIWAGSIPLGIYFALKRKWESVSTCIVVFAMTFYQIAILIHSQFSLVGR